MTEPLPLRAGSESSGRAEQVVAQLYSEHHGALVGMAGALLESPADADHVVQECFVRLSASFTKSRDVGVALAYIRTAVLNETRARLRGSSGGRTPATSPPFVEPDPDDGLGDLARAERQSVRAAVRALPRRELQCVALRYSLGCSDPEIADTLGIGVGAVNQHLARAFGALTAALGHLP